MKEKIIAYVKSVFAEADGSASMSRILAGVVVAAPIFWITYLVVKNGALPDLTSASLFVGSGFTGYGINQARRAFEKKDPQ